MKDDAGTISVDELKVALATLTEMAEDLADQAAKLKDATDYVRDLISAANPSQVIYLKEPRLQCPGYPNVCSGMCHGH